MSRRIVCLALLIVCALMSERDADGQVVRRLRERRAALFAPPVDPAAPAQSAAPLTPPATGFSETGGSPMPLRGGFIARRLQMRRDLVAQQAAEAQPTPAPPTPPQQAAQQRGPQQRPAQQALARRQPLQALRQASAIAAPAMRALSRQEITGMELPALQTALSNTSGELSNELSRFSSAESWQGFLNLPGGIVDEGTIDLAALETSLQRFEKVAQDPNFAQIANLQSFTQARSILNELVGRADANVSDGPQLIDPVGSTELSTESTEEAAESLPAPQPQLPMNRGEHSILVRTGKS